MKNIMFFAILIFAVVFTGCNKEVYEETTPKVDDVAIRAAAEKITLLSQVEFKKLSDAQTRKGAASLSDEEVINALSEPGTKSAPLNHSIYINLLDSREFIVTETSVTRFTYYLEINGEENPVHEYTFSQTYKIKDGKVDETSFSFDFEFDCPQAREMRIDKVTNPMDISLFYVSDDNKNHFSHNVNNYYGGIKIVPLSKFKSLVQGLNNGNTQQNFVSPLFDCYTGNNIIPIMLVLENSNIISQVEVEKSLLLGAKSIQFFGSETSDGGQERKFCKVINLEQMGEVLKYGLPFVPTGVSICGDYGCYWYETEVYAVPVQGSNVTIYRLKK